MFPLDDVIMEIGMFRESQGNTMAADELAPYVARSSAAMVLTV